MGKEKRTSQSKRTKGERTKGRMRTWFNSKREAITEQKKRSDLNHTIAKVKKTNGNVYYYVGSQAAIHMLRFNKRIDEYNILLKPINNEEERMFNFKRVR